MIEAIVESLQEKDIFFPVLFAIQEPWVLLWRFLVVPNKVNVIEGITVHFRIPVDESFKEIDRARNVFLGFCPQSRYACDC